MQCDSRRSLRCWTFGVRRSRLLQSTIGLAVLVSLVKFFSIQRGVRSSTHSLRGSTHLLCLAVFIFLYRERLNHQTR